MQARLRDGRWIAVVRGCRSEDEAQRVEFIVERVLERDDEHGAVEDDERSEVYSEWRDAIGPGPGWVRVEQDGEGMRITCRKPLRSIMGYAVALGVGLALGLYVLLHTGASGGAAAVWGMIVALLLAALVREIVASCAGRRTGFCLSHNARAAGRLATGRDAAEHDRFARLPQPHHPEAQGQVRIAARAPI